MPRSLPLTVVQAVNAQSTDKAFLVLLQAEHSEIAIQRFVNNTQNVVSNGATFFAMPFSVILPPDAEDLPVRARLSIDNADNSLVGVLRGIAGSREPLSVTITIVAHDDPDTALQRISGLKASGVNYSAGSLSMDLSIDNFLTEPFPGDSFTPANFPGIF